MKNKVVFILLFLIFVSGFVFAIDSEKQIFVNEENKNLKAGKRICFSAFFLFLNFGESDNSIKTNI